MSESTKELSQSLKTGFIDHAIVSKLEYLPQLLINEQREGIKFLTTIERELNSCDEFWFSVAFVTTSGIATLINTLIELEQKGVKGKILVSSYLTFTQPEALRRLMLFKNIELKVIEVGDFHSKGYLFKNNELYDLIIGSSNLTASALCTNREWNLKVSATPASYIIGSALTEFTNEFNKGVKVDNEFIDRYTLRYINQSQSRVQSQNSLTPLIEGTIKPNSMQIEALENLGKLRLEGKTKALLISATGTGKTYLSAFDAKTFNAKKVLFVVHRLNIAEAAMKTFKLVFGSSRTMGLYSGGILARDEDFIFSTVQTISKDTHLNLFARDHFDYIVIDESHRAGADSYQKLLNYFTAKFLLGMTATPERTDGFDIFKIYDHTIAYEIRLHRALQEDMLSPFHYYGVTDITVNDQLLEDNSDFKLLTSKERIDRVIEKAKLYGCDDGRIRGLIFCSNIDECKALSEGFNLRGYRTVALTGESLEEERTDAINRLETNSEEFALDYIFTRDIFNEGIDIPRVNQIIMLRPTQSAIVFVQQLGRGLRKTTGKEYLTVIDFIGNYSNNYLVPIALYGDTSYNKDTLRNYLTNGSRFIPGSSTINFDKISKDKIFKSLDSANLQLKRDLVNDYQLLKFKLGRIPMMEDFIEHGSRDAQLYVNYSKSYYNFVISQEEFMAKSLDKREIKLLELFSNEINNSKRVEESVILELLVKYGHIDFQTIKENIYSRYQYNTSDKTIESCIRNINCEFTTETQNGKVLSVHQIHKTNVLFVENRIIQFHEEFSHILKNNIFFAFFIDSVRYSIKKFDQLMDTPKFNNGFVYYRKYSRKDVFRILNWDQNPIAQNVGGYIISPDKSNCPIFVNYHKEEHISNTTKYEDGFLNPNQFAWMTKSKRTLNSPDVKAIMNYKSGLRLPLFIKKSNGEGFDFYYMGDVTPILDSIQQTTMQDNDRKQVSVVKMSFTMNHPVEDYIYTYIISAQA